MTFVRSRFNYDRDLASLRSGVSFAGSEDMAQQQFKDECDINVLMRRYQEEGVPPPTNPNQPQWGDFSAYDFQEAMNTVIEAQQLFSELPSHLRNRFANDPVQLLEWVHNPSNAAEAVELGFLDRDKLPPGWGSLPNPKTPPTPPAEPTGA